MTRGKRNPNPCSVGDCAAQAWGLGLCQKHYTRLARHGSTDDPVARPESERFWAMVDRSGECWTWQGHRDTRGYGKFTQDGAVTEFAHRYAYIEANGPIPPGTHTDHLCRNTSCVRPSHLEVVTPRENTMRGFGPTALNAVKTHCVRGHEFTPENTYMKGTRRVCRECKRADDRKRRRLRRTA